MPNGHPPLNAEFAKALACHKATEAVVRDLRVVAANADTDQVRRLAKETIKLALTLRKRAENRWRSVSTKYASQPSLLEDAASTIKEGDQVAAECKEELDRLEAGTQAPTKGKD